jgi:transposase-like protein
MAPIEEFVHDLVDLRFAERHSRGKPRAHVRKVEDRMRRRVGHGVSKAVAARVLGVSTNTLDKWIARGRVPTVEGTSGRQAVALEPLVELATEVAQLREAGQTDGLLAAAILELEQKDPVYRRDFNDLYGESVAAAERGELVSATVPESFGPED